MDRGWGDDAVIDNQTPYPDAEVRAIVTRGMNASAGPKPAKVRVLYRTSRTDTRLGFTPYDRSRPMDIWIEPPDRYPQAGARSWRDELLTTTLHEMNHYRNPGCRGDACEATAESYAQGCRRAKGSAPGWCSVRVQTARRTTDRAARRRGVR